MLHKFLRHRLLAGITVSLVVFAVLSSLYLSGFLHTWHLRTSDSLYSVGRPLSEIAIVAIDDRSLQEIGRWPWDRRQFADAITLLKAAKVVGIDVSFFEPSDDDQLLQDAISSEGNVVLAAEYSAFSRKDGRLYGELFMKPVVDSDYGYVNLFTEADGVTRKAPLYMAGDEGSKSFGLVIAEKYLGIPITPPIETILINFFGPPNSYETIPFADLVKGRYDASKLDGKIVLIGATSTDLHDEQYVPVSGGKAMSGVEINANLVQTLVLRDYIFRQDAASTILVMFILSLLTGLAMSKLRMLFATAAAVLIIIGYTLLSIAMIEQGLVMNILYPAVSVASVFVVIIILYYGIEKKNKEWVTSIFGKYVSPAVVDEILETTTKDEVRLGGTKRTITALFADIRGFTALSEKMTPEQVIDMLNHYFGDMTEKVFSHGGTLDKYMGDCLMAFFNAPLKQKDHTIKALKAALEMQASAKELAKKEGMPAVKYGIGVNTGPAVVGNMGSEKRLDYTIIGDAVNLASRLCSKAEGDKVIIAEGTYRLVKDRVKVKKVGKMGFKGKAKPIMVYEVLEVK
ncbi:MAG: adenylate/guanylate cyclase domain-containing protein [Candidatus Aenigmarchaeota archaeon]